MHPTLTLLTLLTLTTLLALTPHPCLGQSITITGPATRPPTTSRIRLTTTTTLSPPVSYTWTCTDPSPCTLPVALSSASLPYLVLPPSSLTPATSYSLSVFASSPSGSAQSSITLTTAGTPSQGTCSAALVGSRDLAGYSLPLVNVSCVGATGDGSLEFDLSYLPLELVRSGVGGYSLLAGTVPLGPGGFFTQLVLPPFTVANASLDYRLTVRTFVNGGSPVSGVVNVTADNGSAGDTLQTINALLADNGAVFAPSGSPLSAYNAVIALLNRGGITSDSLVPAVTSLFNALSSFASAISSSPPTYTAHPVSTHLLSETLDVIDRASSLFSVVPANSTSLLAASSQLMAAFSANSLPVSDSAFTSAVLALRGIWSSLATGARTPDGRIFLQPADYDAGLASLGTLVRGFTSPFLAGEQASFSFGASSAEAALLTGLYLSHYDCGVDATTAGFGVGPLCAAPFTTAVSGNTVFDVVSLTSNTGFPLPSTSSAARRRRTGQRTLLENAQKSFTRITFPCHALVYAAGSGSSPVPISSLSAGVPVLCDRSLISSTVPKEKLRRCATFDQASLQYVRSTAGYNQGSRLCILTSFPSEFAVFDVSTDPDNFFYLGILLLFSLPAVFFLVYVVWVLGAKSRQRTKYQHLQLSELSYYSADSGSHTTAHVPAIIPSLSTSAASTHSLSLDSTSSLPSSEDEESSPSSSASTTS